MVMAYPYLQMLNHQDVWEISLFAPTISSFSGFSGGCRCSTIFVLASSCGGSPAAGVESSALPTLPSGWKSERRQAETFARPCARSLNAWSGEYRRGKTSCGVMWGLDHLLMYIQYIQYIHIYTLHAVYKNYKSLYNHNVDTLPLWTINSNRSKHFWAHVFADLSPLRMSKNSIG